MKKILITGSLGFIGKNLVTKLQELGSYELYLFDRHQSIEELVGAIDEVDFIFHLAGVNRPTNEIEFFEGNQNLTEFIVDYLSQTKHYIPILLTSSIHASHDNPYGKSKKAAEDAVLEYENHTGTPCYIYRLPNVFGKWCRPNYNSAVATFCYHIAHDLEISVTDRSKELSLVYIDDVIHCFIQTLNNHPTSSLNLAVKPSYQKSLGDIVDLIYDFKNSRQSLVISNMGDDFVKKLYSTYLSYLEPANFKYSLEMKKDERGSFTEVLKNQSFGQVSINISKPGITKGEHYHHTKVEKFMVVSGKGIIRLRKIDETSCYEFKVSGEVLEVIDIPPGYTHDIVNTSDTDLITLIWVNERFDSKNPDTVSLEV